MYTNVLSSLTLIHIELFRLCYELQNLTVTLLLGAHKTMLLNIYAAAVMSQKCKAVKRSAEPDSINWELCCLCQEEKDDHLQCPINAKEPKCRYGYLAKIY